MPGDRPGQGVPSAGPRAARVRHPGLVFCGGGRRRALHSFPTRRSSDLGGSLRSVRDTLVRIIGGEWGWLKCWKEPSPGPRSEEHTSELQSHVNLVCRLLLEKKKNQEFGRAS